MSLLRKRLNLSRPTSEQGGVCPWQDTMRRLQWTLSAGTQEHHFANPPPWPGSGVHERAWHTAT